jgi:hypothetical protein
VRAALSEPAFRDPAKVRVLGGIKVPGGDIPNKWGRDHVHVSLGEPLDSFAKVEIHGTKLP